MNDWLYFDFLSLRGSDNFAQRFNICKQKFVTRRLSPSRGYAPGNSYWCPCGFDPFVANPYIAHTYHAESKFWHG